MEFGQMLQQLWRLRLLVALGVLVAAFAAINAGYRVDLSPFSVHQRTGTFGAAEVVLYIDSPRSSIVTASNDYQTLTARAQILARFISSAEVRARAARELGVRPTDILVQGPFPDQAGSQNIQPAAQQRANALLSRGAPYSVFVDTESSVPTITLFVQAPDGRLADRLGQATAGALEAYVRGLTRDARREELQRAGDEIDALEAENDRTLSAAERRRQRRTFLDRGTTVRAIGQPVAGDVRDQTGRLVVVLVFIAVLAAWCVALLLASGVVRAVRPRR
jgi:hypothetical protein